MFAECPAGLCRVIGVSRCRAKTWNSYPFQSHNYKSIGFKFGVGDCVSKFTNPAKFGLDPISSSDSRWWWNIRVLWFISFSFNFSLVFCLFTTRAAQTRDPICTHNVSNDAVWRKEVVFKQVFY